MYGAYLGQRVLEVSQVPALGRPLEIPTAEISKAILGPPESPDDKDYMRVYNKDTVNDGVSGTGCFH